MPSPFPGMNPFLEQSDAWQDFHNRYVPALADALGALVRPNYIVKIQEHVFIHEPAAEHRLLVGHADVSVARPNNGSKSQGGTATLISPTMARIPSVDFEKHLFLELRDREDRELVTVLEVLSPTNKKPGPDREQYLAKRAHLLHSNAHFVEIDLLRGGPRMPIEKAKECDYSIMVSRVEDRPDVNYWPISLRDPLPAIPIPLRPPHAFVNLDLQSVLHVVYDRAGYRDYVYRKTPMPPLNPEDAAWATALISAHP
jgi:Protein of unknown function (DUF4058)